MCRSLYNKKLNIPINTHKGQFIDKQKLLNAKSNLLAIY